MDYRAYKRRKQRRAERRKMEDASMEMWDGGDSISTTMFSKCRDHLTKEEFEKVFVTKLLTP